MKYTQPRVERLKLVASMQRDGSGVLCASLELCDPD